MKKQNILKAFFVVLAIILFAAAGNTFAAGSNEQVLIVNRQAKSANAKSASKKTKASKAKAQTLKIDNNTAGMTATEAKVYKKLKAQMKKYPEGMSWTNNNSYCFKGGYFSIGYGCSAFAFLMSDTVFGTRKASMHTNFDQIRVGDIVRVDNNTHSVIVLKVVGDSLVVAEGNYGDAIHWGRIIERSELKATGTYVMTRY